MHLDKARHQMSIEQMELPLERRGEAPRVQRSGEATSAAYGPERSGLNAPHLMERIVERGNLLRALQRVQRKKRSSPGVDGRTVKDLPDDLRAVWPAIREQLLTGSYRPTVVKRVEIPKLGGGVRQLGIPTVLDRFIQQAVLQVPHEPQLSEPPDADPHVRWCGREVGELDSPTPYPDSDTTVTSLAVLPFENVGGDTSGSYFADGMTDELATALAKVPGLRLASRTTSWGGLRALSWFIDPMTDVSPSAASNNAKSR